MNTDIVKYPDFPLTTKEEEDVYKLASAGMRPAEIAVSMEWPPERRRAFCIIAELPGSPLALMLAAARAEGIATPQIKLQEAATAGNIDAIKELQKIQARNRFNELVNYLDDDEFTSQNYRSKTAFLYFWLRFLPLCRSHPQRLRHCRLDGNWDGRIV